MGFFTLTRTHYTMADKPVWSYHGKRFRSVSNSNNGEVSDETTFSYQQQGRVISAEYQGGEIKKGNLLGQVDQEGTIIMQYQHWNIRDEFRSGRCISVPEVLPNGKIRLHESWEWTSGMEGSGTSIVEEI